jgi:YHS domain-containing protein
MNKFLFAAFILFISVSFAFAQEKSKDEPKETKETKTLETKTIVEDGKPFNTICPVSKEEADPEITYEYKGVTYAVCCNNCLKKLKADPEKYISRLSEDGKSVKKKEEK